MILQSSMGVRLSWPARVVMVATAMTVLPLSVTFFSVDVSADDPDNEQVGIVAQPVGRPPADPEKVLVVLTVDGKETSYDDFVGEGRGIDFMPGLAIQIPAGLAAVVPVRRRCQHINEHWRIGIVV